MSMRSIFLISLMILVCPCFSTIILVQEDFGGEEFPPPGWIINNGPNCSWYNGGGFARGRVALPTGYSSGSGNFLSPEFTLCEGDTCLVYFLGRRFWDPYAPPSPSGGGWKISLRLDNVDIWEMYLSSSSSWVPTSVEIPITLSAPTYRFCWRLFGILEDYISARSIYFDIDDVLIRLTATGVEPASLGKIKAACR